MTSLGGCQTISEFPLVKDSGRACVRAQNPSTRRVLPPTHRLPVYFSVKGSQNPLQEGDSEREREEGGRATREARVYIAEKEGSRTLTEPGLR